MGEDWIRKTEKSYRRSIQKAIETRLLPKPLLIAPELETTRYPCMIREGSAVPAVGTHLLIHRSEDGRLAVVKEHRIIGSLSGEAQQDLAQVFDDNPELCGILEVETADADPETSHIELELVRKGELTQSRKAS